MGADTDGTDATRAAYVHSWGSPVWQDEFEYTGSQAELEAHGWSLYDGPGHDNNGIRTPAAFSVLNGFLRCHGDAQMNTGGMDNERTFSAQYYRVEARMRVNNSGASNGGAEYHPVLILWPDGDIPWPQGGEYDYAEVDSNETTMEAYMHHPSTDQGDQNGYIFSDTGLQPAGWKLGDWHNYALEWSPTALKGYIDGVLWFTDTNAVNSNKMHQTIQLDSFHATGTLMQPVDMDVAWVRAYSITGTGQVGVGTGGGTSGGGTGLSDDSIYHTTFEEMSYEITSTAENSTLDWTGVYPYIQDIGDGRGYTCGLVGFTSADGDLLDVINAYNTLSPGNQLSSYTSALATLKSEGEGSSAGTRANQLLGADFKTKWASLNASDPLLRQAQRQIRDSEYWLPAFEQAIADGVQGLGLAILYDISVNHGPGTDPQSFGGIVATAQAAASPPSQGGSESAYLTALVNARKDVLIATGDYQTDGRVQAHQSLIASGNLTLTAPFSWTMYGDPFTISVRPELPADARRPNNLEPGAPTDPGTGGSGGGGGTIDPTGEAPGTVYDLTPWYLTPPNDSNSDGVVDEVDQPQLATYQSTYFTIDSQGRMVMTSPVQGITTSGSGATRCELREMQDGVHADWAISSTSLRQLTVTGVWDPTSITGTGALKVMIVGQIHGSSGTPPIYLTIDHDHSPPRMRLFQNGPGVGDILTGLTATTKATYRIRVESGQVKIWAAVGDVADLPTSPQYTFLASDFTDGADCYFKFGAYNKTDVSTGATGQAIAYISHYELIQNGTAFTGDAADALGTGGGGGTGETGGGGTTGGGTGQTFPTSQSFIQPATFSEVLVTAAELQTIPSNMDTLCLLATGVPTWRNPQTRPMVKLIRAASFSMDSGGTLISWDTELQDSDDMFDLSGAPTLLTIKTAGWYYLTLQVSAATGSGHRQCALTVNSTSLSTAAAVRDEWLGTTSIAHIQCHLYEYFQAGDVIRAYGLSASTVSSDPDEGGTWLSAIWDGRAADDPVPAYVPLGYGTSGYGTSGYGL